MTAWRIFAIVGWGVAVVGVVGAIVVRLVTQAPLLPVTFGFGPAAMVAFITMGLSWASIGAFLLIRRPENASRVQRVVDRRFHRARYDAEQTVAGLAGRLRDEVDMARLRQDILDVVDASVSPTTIHLWLRPGRAR